MYLTANELMGFPGFPGTIQGIRAKLRKLAGDNPRLVRNRQDSRALEYSIDCFSLSEQEIIKSRFYAQALEAQEPVVIEPTKVTPPRSAQLIDELDLVRQCPALLDAKVGELTGTQKDIADARAMLAQEVFRLINRGSSRAGAVKFISEQSRAHALPSHLQRAADIANARKGTSRKGISVRSLQEWVTIYQSTNNGGERLALLAPGHHKARKPEQVAWLPIFLVFWRDPQGFSMKACHEKFSDAWNDRYKDEPAMLAALPSYYAVRRALNKMSKRELMRGRVTGSAATALEPYQKRDWSQLPVNGCWVSDGKSLNMKVAHPIHGRPFTPELTLVIDARSRFVVGWSLSYSENALGVAEAYAHGIRHYGKPLIVYSDNGGGQTNNMLDDELLGIFSRLGIDSGDGEHITGIPGHPQARGIIERLNGVIPLRIAQSFATYNGKRADREHVRVLDRAIASAVNASQKGKELTPRQVTALNKLPSWGALMDAIQYEVDRYNNGHEHSELPKYNGKHLTPKQYREAVLLAEGDDIEYLSEIELREMFKPQFIRTCSRAWIQFDSNNYFAYELADYDGQDVRIGIDIHDPNEINVYRLDGTWICKALWNGNTRAAIPVSMVESAKAKRAKRQIKKLEDKIDVIHQETRPVIDHKPDFSGFIPTDEPIVAPRKPITFLQSEYDYLSAKAGNQ